MSSWYYRIERRYTPSMPHPLFNVLPRDLIAVEAEDPAFADTILAYRMSEEGPNPTSKYLGTVKEFMTRYEADSDYVTNCLGRIVPVSYAFGQVIDNARAQRCPECTTVDGVSPGCASCRFTGMRDLWRLRYQKRGGHYHCVLWVGRPGQGSNCGQMTFDEYGFRSLRDQQRRNTLWTFHEFDPQGEDEGEG